MPYATSDIQLIITNLESALAQGAAEVMFEGRKITYRSVSEIRNAIAYFTSLLPIATDAPLVPVKKVRTLFFYGNKGFKLGS